MKTQQYTKRLFLCLIAIFTMLTIKAQSLNDNDPYWRSVKKEYEQGKKGALIAYSKLKTIGFIDFLKVFTKNREMQISLIHRPFIIETWDWNSNIEGKTTKEYIYDITSKNWTFMKYSDFLFGYRNEITECNFSGSWEIKNNIVTYTASGYGNGCLYLYTFKKNNNKWLLYSFRDTSM